MNKSGERLRAGSRSSHAERPGAILGAHKGMYGQELSANSRRETYSIHVAKTRSICALFIGLRLLCMV